MLTNFIDVRYFDSSRFALESKSEEETLKFSSFFLNHFLKEKSIVFLIGNLGSGKTTFVKGISRVFEVEEEKITSPSFNIIRKYQDKSNTFYHIDLYRIQKEEEIEELYLDELLIQKNTYVFIEWANKFLDYLKLLYLAYPIWSISFNLLDEMKLKIQVELIEKNDV